MTRSHHRQAGGAIRRLRRERGIPTGELAKRVNVHRDALCHVEGGRQQASWELLARVARELDVPLAELLSEGGRNELTGVPA